MLLIKLGCVFVLVISIMELIIGYGWLMVELNDVICLKYVLIDNYVFRSLIWNFFEF